MSNGESGSGRSSAVDSASTNSAVLDEDGIVCIAAHGDLVLRIEHEFKSGKQDARFRVSTPALRQHSKYFARLLQVDRFGEGANVEAQHSVLRERYKSMTEVPAPDLPAVTVADIGRISPVKAVASLLTDFLYILHGKDTQSFPPVANLANLAIVADRFDALEVVKSYVRRKKMIRAIDGKTNAKADVTLSEEKVRQRLLVAVMLDYPPWLEKYSARMIVKGWVGNEAEIATPLWWDLPARVEEELACRRECVLDAVQSLQSYFFGLYTSRARQCKLGYDSSAQCDSFQLGEMVRFFLRAGTLKLQGAVIDSSEPPESYAGDIYALLDNLRQVPEYQIDRHHAHCGIRTRIIPLLDLIAECLLLVGICSECWINARDEYAWMDAKRPLVWKRQQFSLRAQGHRNRHADLRAMFMASERDWS